jgi:hypothetical protein
MYLHCQVVLICLAKLPATSHGRVCSCRVTGIPIFFSKKRTESEKAYMTSTWTGSCTYSAKESISMADCN